MGVIKSLITPIFGSSPESYCNWAARGAAEAAESRGWLNAMQLPRIDKEVDCSGQLSAAASAAPRRRS